VHRPEIIAINIIPAAFIQRLILPASGPSSGLDALDDVAGFAGVEQFPLLLHDLHLQFPHFLLRRFAVHSDDRRPEIGFFHSAKLQGKWRWLIAISWSRPIGSTGIL